MADSLLDMNKVFIGARLMQARIKAGLTPDYVALAVVRHSREIKTSQEDVLQLTSQRLCDIELGKAAASATLLMMLSYLYHVDVQHLAGEPKPELILSGIPKLEAKRAETLGRVLYAALQKRRTDNMIDFGLPLGGTTLPSSPVIPFELLDAEDQALFAELAAQVLGFTFKVANRG